MSFEGFTFPTGQTNAQLYQHCRNQTQQLRSILQQVAAGGDLTALQDQIAATQTQLDELQELFEIGGGEISPQFLAEHELITAGENIRGSLAQVSNRQLTLLESNAEATMRAAIEAHRGSTGLRTEVTVRDGLTQVLNAVMASLGVTGASLTELRQAVATGDAAAATYIQAASSQVAGNIAQIFITQSSVDGIAAQFGVAINLNGEVIGAVQLDGTPLGSNFTVAVDNFRVAKAGTTGGGSVPVFSIQTVGGVAKIAFVGDMIADGSIIARNIAAGSITADKIDVDELTAISANFGDATVTGQLTGGPTGKLIIDLTLGRIRALA